MAKKKDKSSDSLDEKEEKAIEDIVKSTEKLEDAIDTLVENEEVVIPERIYDGIEEPSVEETPTEETPVEETPTEETPVEDELLANQLIELMNQAEKTPFKQMSEAKQEIMKTFINFLIDYVTEDEEQEIETYIETEVPQETSPFFASLEKVSKKIDNIENIIMARNPMDYLPNRD